VNITTFTARAGSGTLPVDIKAGKELPANYSGESNMALLSLSLFGDLTSAIIYQFLVGIISPIPTNIYQ